MQNNPFLPNFSLYFLILFVAYLSTYFIGRLISSFVHTLAQTPNKIENTFYNLTIGFVVLVSTYAILWTKGNSIYLTSLLIGLIYLFIRDKNESPTIRFIKFSKVELYTLLKVFLFFGVFFFISYYMFFIRSGGIIWTDQQYYANVSYVISIFHRESFNVLLENTPGVNMYHYSEIWFTSIFSTIFAVNHLYVLYLVTYTYFFSICILGAISIAQIYHKGIIIPIILGLSLLFLVPIIAFLRIYIHPIATNPKYFDIVIFLLASAIHLLRKRYTLAIITLLLLIPFYSTVSPGVLSGIFVVVICWKYTIYGLKYKMIINRYTIACVVVFVFFVLFYYVQSIINHNQNSSQIAILYDHPIRRTLLFILKRTSRVLLLLLPISISLSYLNYKKGIKSNFNYLPLIGFTVFGAFFSSIIGGLTSLIDINGAQVCTNFIDTALPTMVFICLVYILSLLDFKKTRIIAILAFIIYLSFFMYKGTLGVYQSANNATLKKESIFYSEIKNEILANSNSKFAYYRNYEIEENLNTMSTLMNQFHPLSKLAHFIKSGYYAPYCLSVFDIPNNIDPRYDERQQSDFWKYVFQKRKKQPMISIEDCALSFIKVKQIKYIIIEKYAIEPNYLFNKAKLLNEYDGNKIYKMN